MIDELLAGHCFYNSHPKSRQCISCNDTKAQLLAEILKGAEAYQQAHGTSQADPQIRVVQAVPVTYLTELFNVKKENKMKPNKDETNNDGASVSF